MKMNIIMLGIIDRNQLMLLLRSMGNPYCVMITFMTLKLKKPIEQNINHGKNMIIIEKSSLIKTFKWFRRIGMIC